MTVWNHIEAQRFVNPTVVLCPDGRMGCLVHIMNGLGAVEFGSDQILGAYPLNKLMFVLIETVKP